MGVFARAAVKAFDQGVGTLAAGAHVLQLGAGRSATGISVTTDKALRYSAFWAGVRILAESIATLPVNIIRIAPDGSREVVRTHPVHRLLHDVANPQMTAYAFREVSMAHVTTWGTSFALKVRDGTRALRQLWPLAPERTEVERNATGELEFRYVRSNGERVNLTAADVFYVPGLSWDGVRGYSVIRQARETIGLGLAAEEHGARFFGNGATTSFVLSSPAKLSDDAVRHLTEQLADDKTGLSNAWRPWVLEEGLEPKVLSMPNDDAQWLETRKHQVTDIARWFRIPPHMLADLERATFSNIESQALEFVKYTLMPWIVRWEQAIGLQLLGAEWTGLGGDLYPKFNVAALERADIKTRFESYQIGRNGGFITPNQVAELEDWPQFGEGGDERLRPLNMVGENALDERGMSFRDRIEATGVLVRAGFDPAGALAALDLPAIEHTGLVPITVQVDPATLSPSPARNGASPGAMT